METTVTYTDDTAYFSSDVIRWKNRINKLKEKYPDKVQILATPETNDGCIYCTFPASWLRVAPPQQRTPEQIAQAVLNFQRCPDRNARGQRPLGAN